MGWRRFGPFLLGVLLVIFMLLVIPRASYPHDSWISRGGLRNAAGEWCCGAGDCVVLDPAWVEARADGYHVAVRALGQAWAVPTRTEIVPYAEARASPDGAYRRCQRANGSRRGFFAPGPRS